MKNPWLRVALFVAALVAMFVWAAESLDRASGNTRPESAGDAVSAANGEAIFWGSGKCHACHAVGARGRSVRGPDLGVSDGGEAMMARAARGAAERSAALGREVSATDYLVESLVDPGAYVVRGYKDEMPAIHEPPIQLTPDDLRSVVLYLQTLGGQPDPASIDIPQQVLRDHRAAAEVSSWEPYIDGDSARGRALFFDPDGAAGCAGCHRVGDEGEEIGPELTTVAGTRTLRFIMESLMRPSATIPAGYETELVETIDGRILDGLARRETADSLWLVTALGEEHALATAEVARRRTQDTSLMPEDLADNLSVRQLHDLLAYLSTLR